MKTLFDDGGIKVIDSGETVEQTKNKLADTMRKAGVSEDDIQKIIGTQNTKKEK